MAQLIDASGVVVFEGEIVDGGSQPGALQIAEMTFAEVAGGSHTYTASVDLPADSTLLGVEMQVSAEWDGGADINWDVGDESSPTNIVAGSSQGFVGDAFAAWYKANTADFGGTSLLGHGVAYPSGQTITCVAGPDAAGGTGASTVRVYYYAAPTQHAAVVT